MANEIGEIECKLENCLADADGSLVVSLRVPMGEAYAARQIVADARIGLANGKERLKVAFSWYHEKRSLNANSYFHVLVDKIAKAVGQSAEAIKNKMVLDYGTMATQGGDPIIAALPKDAEIEKYYPYAKWIGDFTAKNKMRYSQYVLYKQTHTLDKKEMAKLIDGVIQEAQDLGIETRTPDELASMIEKWEGCP